MTSSPTKQTYEAETQSPIEILERLMRKTLRVQRKNYRQPGRISRQPISRIPSCRSLENSQIPSEFRDMCDRESRPYRTSQTSARGSESKSVLAAMRAGDDSSPQQPRESNNPGSQQPKRGRFRG